MLVNDDDNDDEYHHHHHSSCGGGGAVAKLEFLCRRLRIIDVRVGNSAGDGAGDVTGYLRQQWRCRG